MNERVGLKPQSPKVQLCLEGNRSIISTRWLIRRDTLSTAPSAAVDMRGHVHNSNFARLEERILHNIKD